MSEDRVLRSATYLDGKISVLPGDCLDSLRGLPDCSVDSVVTDPPYALVSITRRFGKDGAAAPKSGGATGVYKRAASGFMGKSWDTGERAFAEDFWREVWRVLKPGGHVAAFSGTRTYHHLALAIENGGFEIRDQLAWAYGSGFPKSHDVSKGIDKAAGAARAVLAQGAPVKRMIPGADQNKDGCWIKDNGRDYVPTVTAPATSDAARWQGWGTALKPAWEPICLARKPLIGTVAENVLAHGTGAINVDACRVEISAADQAATEKKNAHGDFGSKPRGQGNVYGADHSLQSNYSAALGRWPANILTDGSHEGEHWRYFYSAKADAEDRIGSKHPTVKPVDLMQWLCRLITPPGGVVLDPFAGSGTTGEAAWREGFSAILCEREAEYLADIARRLNLADKGKIARTAAKAARGAAAAPMPLFDAPAEGGADGSTAPSRIRPENRADGVEEVMR